MTHFPTLVICKSPDDLHELLLPYNENIETEPYEQDCGWCQGTGVYQGKGIEAREGFPAVNPGDPCPATTGGRYGESGGCMNGKMWSTYNPKSKWDWYQIGGRFPNRLVANPGAKTIEADLSWTWDEATEEQKAVLSTCCAGARKKDLNWDMMGHLKVEGLKKAWAGYQEDLMNGRSPEQASWMWGPEMGDTEDSFIRRRMKFEIGAIVTPDGEWHEQGQHGWFGSQDEGMGPRAWNDMTQDLIDLADPEEWFIVVDCHI